MPLSNMQLTGRRRGRGPLAGGIGLPGALAGGMGGIGSVPYGGGLALARGGRGFDPLTRLGYGGLGTGALMRGGTSPLATRNILGGSDPMAAFRGARYPMSVTHLGRRGFDDLSPGIGHDPSHRDLNLLLSLSDLRRGLCDGRGCRGGMGCGYDRRCEHERCMYDCGRCSEPSSSSSTKDLKTKDIVVRGKTYKIRKAFLQDLSKFEADIIKLLDKKSEESVPNEVVQMLVDFINYEKCDGRTLLDVVSLNILASNLGVKSAVEFSLNLLKNHVLDYQMKAQELTDICLAVMESSKVEDKLVEWLKRYLKSDGREWQLVRSYEYQSMIARRPELDIHLAQLTGQMEKDEYEEEYRVI